MRTIRRELASPLARYGTTALTVLAATGGQWIAAAITGAAAIACWCTTRP